jgi:hypothetical protein
MTNATCLVLQKQNEFDEIDQMDPMVAPLDELQGLMDRASTPFLKGFLTGIHNFRQQLSILTQREF